jgi:hypothetical protein
MQRLPGLWKTGRTRTKAVALSGVMVLAAGAVAIAAPTGSFTSSTAAPNPGLVAAGPVNGTFGFPDWYRDTNGTNLAPCWDAQDPNCGGAVPTPDIAAPLSFPDNFPDEFFYSNAAADGLTASGGNGVLAEFALEGAFGAGPPKANDQIVFTRIRYRINGGLQPDTAYKITHPYGTDVVRTDPGATNLFVTQDVGVAANDFSQALKGRVGPFLRWDKSVDPQAPLGYLGDGVTPHAVTGSDLGTNFVRVEGPNIAGPAGTTNPNPCPTTGANAYTGPVLNCIQTNNFVVIGKESTNGGVDVSRATYSRNADGSGTQIQVLANSKEFMDMRVKDGDHPDTGRLISTTPMRGENGRYVANVDVSGAMPGTVDVVNRSDIPVSTSHVSLSDALTASAVYHVSKAGTGDVLHVTASSSDKTLDGTALTLPDFGNKGFGANGQVDVSTVAPPKTVTVSSSKGGTITVPVQIDGEGMDGLPLVAAAGPDVNVSQGATVTLDGGGSSGDIDSVQWTGPDGITINNATSTKATFTAPTTPGPLTFTLKLTGNGKTVTDEVVVTVKQANPAKAVIAPVADEVLQNLPLTLDGTGSEAAAKYEWTQVDGASVGTISNATTSKATFLFPKTTAPVTMRLTVKRADYAGTGCTAPTCDTSTITLNPKLDNLGAIRAKYDAGKGRWVVDGTSTVLVSNNVRVYAGTTKSAATLIGTALVDPTGAWKVDVRNSTVRPATPNVVTVESDRGGVSQAPVT